jgi:hypothetical protein
VQLRYLGGTKGGATAKAAITACRSGNFVDLCTPHPLEGQGKQEVKRQPAGRPMDGRSKAQAVQKLLKKNFGRGLANCKKLATFAARFSRKHSERPCNRVWLEKEKKFCPGVAELKSLLTFATRSTKGASEGKLKSASRSNGLRKKKKKIARFAWKLEKISDLCTPKNNNRLLRESASSTHTAF